MGKLLGLAREIDNGKESPSMYDVSMSSIQLQSMIIRSQCSGSIDRDWLTRLSDRVVLASMDQSYFKVQTAMHQTTNDQGSEFIRRV